MTSRPIDFDADAILACVDLCARAGATGFEVGYLEDDVPVEQARWYAHIQLRGARLIAEEKTSPEEACDALARQILQGGRCTGCNKTVSLNTASPSLCRWHRDGPAWVRGCDGKRKATKRAE